MSKHNTVAEYKKTILDSFAEIQNQINNSGNLLILTVDGKKVYIKRDSEITIEQGHLTKIAGFGTCVS